MQYINKLEGRICRTCFSRQCRKFLSESKDNEQPGGIAWYIDLNKFGQD
jgi:hypothetical protein